MAASEDAEVVTMDTDMVDDDDEVISLVAYNLSRISS